MNLSRRSSALILLLSLAGCGGAKDQLQLSGSLEANDIRVGSLLGGRVDSVFVEEGDSVHVGDRLVALDATLTEAEIAEQRGRVSEARSRLALTRRGPRREEIAKAKEPDLTAADLEAAVRTIAGSARSMGLVVEG